MSAPANAAARAPRIYTSGPQEKILQDVFYKLEAQKWEENNETKERIAEILQEPSLCNLKRNHITTQLNKYLADRDLHKMIGKWYEFSISYGSTK